MITTENLISFSEFPESSGLRKQTVFKVLRRLGIETIKSRGGGQNRGQTIAYITDHDTAFGAGGARFDQDFRRSKKREAY